MITYGLLLVIFALFGVLLTLSEYEYLVISGDIIVCLCFVVYLVLFILWQSVEIKTEKTTLNEIENEMKKTDEIIKKFKKKQNENNKSE